MQAERAGPIWGAAWGKFSPILGHHHLGHHCADVAAVFQLLLSRRPYRLKAEAALGRILNPTEIGCLTALAFLHDIGKLAPGFQAKIWPRKGHLATIGHLEAGWLWAEAPSGDGPGASWHHVLAAWPELEQWFSMILSHHGRPTSHPGSGRVAATFPTVASYDWQMEHRRIGAAFEAWFPDLDKARPPPAEPAFVHFICGLLTLADWIASDNRAFPYEPRLRDDYWQTALLRAETRIAEIGLAADILTLSGPPGWELISKDHPRPRPAQLAIGGLTTDERLVLLEAETGAGKTEAALWRFAALLAAGEVEALYFAVPTRAAARQLQRRVNAALALMFKPVPEALLAIPGQVVAGEAKGRRLPDFSVLWDDGKARPSRWAAEHSARYLAAPIAIGTVDQVALGGLQVKYAHLRGTALSRALLVIDEVHASDPYMSEVQRRMARDHLALGGHVLLMSATLGASARCRWFGTGIAALPEEAARPYPAVWTAAGIEPVEREARADKAVEMRAHLGWTGADAADLALAAARRGARVLVIRNTVGRAQETFAAVQAEAPELLLQIRGIPTLHHSRFAAEDRALLDSAVEGALGAKGSLGGRVVIGTQTLEQSLDIDADLLITDLCPMDVLLQRIGRLHRHKRARPAGFEMARAVVLCPPGGLDPLVQRADNGLGAYAAGPSLSGVYVDVPGLAATLDQITGQPVWHIPEMNRVLVEAATHPEALARIAEARGWQAYHQRLHGKTLAEMGAADLVILDRQAPLISFPDDEKIRTRLGEEGAMLALPDGTPGAFGLPVRNLTLPAHWSKGLTGEETVELLATAPLRIGVGGKMFGYDSAGLTILATEP
uniref:CRISPR-associated helicase/endonuclease Cas3 n=1 Tax=Paracoccus sp. TRP TaxID=412597 RepID=UPI000225FA1C|nr:CRISPR-associated helicase/endonuclease Cas3 [Paracoccus sp. TRP]